MVVPCPQCQGLGYVVESNRFWEFALVDIIANTLDPDPYFDQYASDHFWELF